MADKSTAQLLKRIAATPGWSVSVTKRSHFRVQGPGGLFFIPGTPSDHRSLKNTKALLKRAGLEVGL